MTIACRLDALRPEEHTRQLELRAELEMATRETRETANGYEFVFRGSPDLLRKAAEWVMLERRCCPFLDFELRWRAADDQPSLTLEGGPGVKAFIADTFTKR